MPDLLSDAAELLKAAGIDSAIVQRVIRELRRRWGGDTPYIPQIDRDTRNETIKQALDTAQPIAVIAKKAGCSPATVRRKRSEWLT